MPHKRAVGPKGISDSRHRTAEQQMAWMFGLGQAVRYAAEHPDDPAPMRAANISLNDLLHAFRSIGAPDPRRTDAIAWLGELQSVIANHFPDKP